MKNKASRTFTAMVAILITIACNAAKAWGQNTDETLYSVTAYDNIAIIPISELMDGTQYEAGETVKFTISLDGLEPSKCRLATVKDADDNVISTEYQYNATDKTESYSFTMPAKNVSINTKDSVANYLTFTSLTDGSSVGISHYINDPNIWYSVNGNSWTPLTTAVTLNNGDVMRLRGVNPQGFSQSAKSYSTFTMTGEISATGTVMSLIDGTGYSKGFSNSMGHCFERLFQNCEGLVSISEGLLSAKNLSTSCYEYMFEDCKNLTELPQGLLPVTTLPTSCYWGMFMNCGKIKEIPEGFLPATMTTTQCYYAMFERCTSLETIPSGLLPATHVNSESYGAMFSGCTSLVSVPHDFMKAQTYANNGINRMFEYCKNLQSIEVEFKAWNTQSTNWLTDIAASGDFYGPADLIQPLLDDPSLRTASTVPDGWTLHMPYDISRSEDVKILTPTTSDGKIHESKKVDFQLPGQDISEDKKIVSKAYYTTIVDGLEEEIDMEVTFDPETKIYSFTMPDADVTVEYNIVGSPTISNVKATGTYGDRPGDFGISADIAINGTWEIIMDNIPIYEPCTTATARFTPYNLDDYTAVEIPASKISWDIKPRPIRIEANNLTIIRGESSTISASAEGLVNNDAVEIHAATITANNAIMLDGYNVYALEKGRDSIRLSIDDPRYKADDLDIAASVEAYSLQYQIEDYDPDGFCGNETASIRIDFPDGQRPAGYNVAEIDNIYHTWTNGNKKSGIVEFPVSDSLKPGLNTFHLTLLKAPGVISDTIEAQVLINASSNRIVKMYNDVLVIDNHDDIFAEGGYKWYKNQELIPGATAQDYQEKPYINGSYSVTATTKHGDVIKICGQHKAIPVFSQKNVPLVSAYPNPTRANEPFSLTISNIDEKELGKLKIQIYNSMGNVVRSLTPDGSTMTLDLPSGIYNGTLTNNSNKKVTTFKLIVE